MRASVASSLLVLALSALPSNAAELIVNGGFELGNFHPTGAFVTYDTITQSGPQDLTGWTVGNSLAWGLNGTDINTHSGSGFVDLTGIGDAKPHGSISQTIATIIGEQYTFSMFVTQDFRGALGFDVLANGVALALSGTPGFWNYISNATYGQITGSFTANSTSTTIAIAGLQLGFTTFMIGLDDVSVQGPAVAPVPVPAALPLLASGLLGFGWFARRRKPKP